MSSGTHPACSVLCGIACWFHARAVTNTFSVLLINLLTISPNIWNPGDSINALILSAPQSFLKHKSLIITSQR